MKFTLGVLHIYQSRFFIIQIFRYAVELIETVGKLYEQCKNASLRAYAARQKTAAQFLSARQEQKPVSTKIVFLIFYIKEYRLDMVISHLIQLKPSVSNRVRTKFILIKNF